ncbi:hypothetical protein W97_01252 [Coniosporium apollinis CBS 100218]|uniref:Uncharacterized protein n=1 Tax=Coniosporium apollinis (strain CBS 100218) TaxID=1168221 RepID=R7YJI1_CONA1|nr:uncharacterized protein W97_01252 [Coniosporium apollinis CBS 100218]EON62033.1 hypothetical protein W97_01252 [Coniosporium apollinis CBS 100218]
MAEFLQRVQSVVWNRKLIRTAKGHYLGLGPEKTEVGDGTDGKPVYTLVGEAYVHGKMDGEAIDFQVENQILVEKFELE